MKSRMYKIACFLILLPCILLNQHFANASNIIIDGNLGEWSNFKTYSTSGNNISHFSMSESIDKNEDKLYLAFNVKENIESFNKDKSALIFNINDSDYKFTVYCNNTVKSDSNDINVTAKSNVNSDDCFYTMEVCADFKGNMPKTINLKMQGIDSKSGLSNVINIEDEQTTKAAATTKSGQSTDRTSSNSTSKSSKSTTTTSAKDNAATEGKYTSGNTVTGKGKNSSLQNGTSAYDSDYTLEQNNAGQDAQNVNNINSNSQSDTSNQSGNKIKRIIGIIVAAILLAAAAILPIIEHKKTKKELTKKDESDDGSGEDEEDS